MYQVTINVSDYRDLARACREVASEIDMGNWSGAIGESDNEWEVDEV